MYSTYAMAYTTVTEISADNLNIVTELYATCIRQFTDDSDYVSTRYIDSSSFISITTSVNDTSSVSRSYSSPVLQHEIIHTSVMGKAESCPHLPIILSTEKSHFDCPPQPLPGIHCNVLPLSSAPGALPPPTSAISLPNFTSKALSCKRTSFLGRGYGPSMVNKLLAPSKVLPQLSSKTVKNGHSSRYISRLQKNVQLLPPPSFCISYANLTIPSALSIKPQTPPPAISAEKHSSTMLTVSKPQTDICHSHSALHQKGQGIRFVLRRAQLPEASTREVDDNAAVKLRKLMIHSEMHQYIPDIIADWPNTRLRLCGIMSPEECERKFVSIDQLWSHLFHGLLIRRSTCRLQCLDFAEFVPNKALLYTTLQLIPLLSYDGILDNGTIIKKILNKHHIKDGKLLDNLSCLLDKLLGHPVLSRGRKLYYKEPLKIIIDNFPLAADNLAFYGWLIASSLSDVTNVYIYIRTIHFSYKKSGTELSPVDPVMPLQVFVDSNEAKDIIGLRLSGMNAKHATKIITGPLDNMAKKGFKLEKFDIFELDLTELPLQDCFLPLISQCTALTRLDLFGSLLPDLLGNILNCLVNPLQEINLKRVCITEEDIQALLNSRHASHLRHVDVSNIYSNKCPVCCPRHSYTRDDDDDDPSVTADDNYGKGSLNINKTVMATNNIHCRHQSDVQLYLALFRNLHKLRTVKVLHMMSAAFGSEPTETEYLNLLLLSTEKLSLCELNIEGIALSDGDILSLISVLSKMPSFRHLTITRSPIHHTFDTRDTSGFRKRILAAMKDGHFEVCISNALD